MAIFKRIIAQVGSSHEAGSKTASEPVICGNCFCHILPALVDGQQVCPLCGKKQRQ